MKKDQELGCVIVLKIQKRSGRGRMQAQLGSRQLLSEMCIDGFVWIWDMK